MNKIVDAIASKGLPARDIKNANRVNLWTFAWVLSLGAIIFLSDYEWYASALPTTIGFLLHAGIGVGMILAFKRFLTVMDELERKIQLDALALSVGVTIVGFSSYSILDKVGVVPELSPAYLIMLMALTYMAGIIIGKVRYR